MHLTRTTLIAACLAGSLTVSGCSSISRDDLSAFVGAGAGVAVGSFLGGGAGQAAAMVAGGVTGLFLGWFWSHELAPEDQLRHDATVQMAVRHAPSNETRHWENPDNGTSGWVEVDRDVNRRGNRQCRSFEQAVTIKGDTERSTGTACRDAAGTWRVE